MQGQSPEVLRVAGRTVVAVDTESAYLRHARGVGRPDAPLPVLAPYWDTFRTTIDGLPTVSETAPRQWHGQVYVCDDRYTGVGEVLAGATGRPCVGAPFAAAVEHSRREPVTVVAPVGAITPELFAALPHDAQLGLFVTRSLASASALAVRTILHGPAAAKAGRTSPSTRSPSRLPPNAGSSVWESPPRSSAARSAPVWRCSRAGATRATA